MPVYYTSEIPCSPRTRLRGPPVVSGLRRAIGVGTAIHALRLMASGLFNRHPKLNVGTGHLGEGLPFMIWRINHRIAQTPRNIPAKRKMGDYLGDNFYLAVSGNFALLRSSTQ